MPNPAPDSSFSAASSFKKTSPDFAEALLASWTKLLTQLRAELDSIGRLQGPDTIPEINFHELTSNTETTEHFSTQVRRRGVAVIRGVISEDVIQDWMGETEQYLGYNNATLEPSGESQPCGYGDNVWWSPVQVKARAHPSLLETQRWLMGLWNISDPETTSLTINFPITCAEPFFIAGAGSCSIGNSCDSQGLNAHATAVGTACMEDIRGKHWEQHDPWDTSALLKEKDTHHREPTIKSPLRMFHGLLSLNHWPAGCSPIQFLPMLRLSNSYLRLRPFFRPKNHLGSRSGFLQPDNWTLETQGSIDTHYTTELQQCILSSNSMLTLPPALNPGDYLIWHRNVLYTPIPTTERIVAIPTPICPLTRKNAIYLAQQRKAFLLGRPVSPRKEGGRDEAVFMGRPSVQEVSDVGGNEGLRAMGLLPWDEDEVETEGEADVLEMVNNVLFPDRYDFDMNR